MESLAAKDSCVGSVEFELVLLCPLWLINQIIQHDNKHDYQYCDRLKSVFLWPIKNPRSLLFLWCVCQSKAGPVTDYVRGEDVLDIWFDSGASWAAVLEGTCENPFNFFS